MSDKILEMQTAPDLSGLLYTTFLKAIDTNLSPRTYFEIGTNTGESLACFGCNAICVDPEFHLTGNPVGTRVFTAFFQTFSDRFFSTYNVKAFFPTGVDVAFLDGLHRFEYLLRDFLNTEKICHRRSVILLHDCLPLNARMAERVYRLNESEAEETRHAWTGDVWKILPALKKYRPDLRVRLLDCQQTGLVAISSLDPQSEVIDKSYDAIADEFRDLDLSDFKISNLRSLFPMLESRKVADPAVMTTYFSTF